MAPGSGPPVLSTQSRNEPTRPPNSEATAPPQLRLRLRRGSHKPGSRGGGGGRRHPRVIGRSNRGPRAQPRVQSSNEEEEELPPKAGKIGYRVIHPASPAYFPNTLSQTALQYVSRSPGLPNCCWKWTRPAWGGGEGKACGKFKKKGKELPFPLLPPFPFVYAFVSLLIWTNISFLLEEEIGEAALFYSHPGGNASFLPRERSWQRDLGLWDMCGIRALCPVCAEAGLVIGLE